MCAALVFLKPDHKEDGFVKIHSKVRIMKNSLGFSIILSCNGWKMKNALSRYGLATKDDTGQPTLLRDGIIKSTAFF